MKVWDKKKICEKLGIPENAPILKSRFLSWIDALDGKEIKSEDMSYPVRFANDIDHLITDFTSERPNTTYKFDINITDRNTIITDVRKIEDKKMSSSQYFTGYTNDYAQKINKHIDMFFERERRNHDND